jgi:lipopolysaccharide/colanic/teichoic acid biosynthesis glycosyltransferase
MKVIMSTVSLSDSAARPGARTPAARAWVDDLVPPSARWYLGAKAALDFIIALALLVLTAPLILLAMLLVKLTSPGPALYSQTRLGRHGRPFTLYKVRTMAHDCESLTGPRWSVPGDSRVTAVGRWLRRTHLDELPQLWNVLRGEMSLVGPRPERPEFVPRLEQAVPHYRKRLQVRPGVTGLAQVQLPPDSDLDSVRLKTAYDLHYVCGLHPLLDLRIAWATLLKLAGVPFDRLRAIFRLPRRDVVEAGYRGLAVRPSPVKVEPGNGTAAADNIPVAG